MKNYGKVSAPVSAILELVLAVIGISNIELSLWWHYIVATLCIIFLYIIIFAFVALLLFLYDRFIARIDYSIDVPTQYEEVGKMCERIEICYSIVSNSSNLKFIDIEKNRLYILSDTAYKKANAIYTHIKNDPIEKQNQDQIKMLEKYMTYFVDIMEKCRPNES